MVDVQCITKKYKKFIKRYKLYVKFFEKISEPEVRGSAFSFFNFLKKLEEIVGRRGATGLIRNEVNNTYCIEFLKILSS